MCSENGFQLRFPLPRNNSAGEKMSHVVCVVLPRFMEKDGHPEREGVLRKLCEGLSTKTLGPRKRPFSFLYLLSLWKAVCLLWELGDPICHVLHCSTQAALALIHSFHFTFLFGFLEQEHIHSHHQWLYLAQPSLKCPYAVSSLDRFFSVSLKMYLNVFHPSPALKCYCDATAVSHLTTETRVLYFP